MATSIAAQLQKIRAITHTEPESTKRPFTRPSILFDPKQAADIDLDALLSLALSGLETLEQIDNRFGSYKNSLFSPNSRDLDRELKGIDENKKIDESIASYLRLVSGYLQLHSALKTLEYLIRRYKIYHYNMDELILCSLPYHDTHVFVRIVQILNLGNSRWKFLEGVKVSGAPPPRSVIVQQCIRDKGVLETLCNYALPTKKYKPSVPVLNFFTAVAVEFLGTLPVIDSDTVRRLLPFVFSGLETNSKAGRDHKASALMMVSLLSNKVALNHKSVKVLIESIARVARQDASESADLPWLRMLLMAMISLVQSQSVEILSKKALELLQETRDFTGVLLGLSKEFNIKRFLYTYLESLATYSSSEHYYHLALASAIEALPVKEFIDNIVAKVLTSCLMLSKSEDSSKLCESGCQTKELLDIMGKKYPSELQRAVHRFLEDPKVKSFKENSFIEKLGAILGGKSNVTPDISDSMILLSLEHPKAEIRRTTLSSLVASGGFKPKTYNSQTLVNIRDAVLRRLHDEDLSVIKTALSLKDLSDIVDSSYLIGALKDVLFRCIDTIMTSELIVTPLACEVAISCLNCAISNFQSQLDFSKGVATMIFPLLLAFAKTWRLNVKALELAKGIKWSLYRDICGPYELISAIDEKKLESSMSTSVNMKIIHALAEAFSANPEEYMTWFDECSKSFALSKTIILLVLLQSFVIRKEEPEHILRLFNTCFHTLKLEWVDIELLEDVPKEEVNSTKLDEDCSRFLEQLQNRNCKALHLDLLICIFWKLLKAFIPSASQNSLADNVDWLGALDSLFTFFVESRSKNLFKEHIKLLVLKCHPSPVLFLTKFHMMEGYSVLVQVESLLSFASICSQTSSSEKCTSDRNLQLVLGFPSVLVPFSSDNQDVRFAAMKCIEALYSLWHNINSSAGKNGYDSLLQQSMWSPFLGELLELLIEQKRLILSDRNFFPAYLTAILSSSTDNILVPLNIDQRFDKRTKEAIFLFILSSALKLSPFGKLKVLLLFKGMSNAVVRVEGVKSLLSELLERRNKCHLGVDKYGQPLSKIEIETLCFLLESCATPSASQSENTPSDQVVEALQLNSFSSEDPAVIQPCVAVLQLLNPVFQCRLKTETQEKVFEELVFLFRNDTASIQNAAKEAILRVKLPISTIVRLLDLFTAQGLGSSGLSNGKKKKKLQKEQGGIPHNSLFFKWENRISFLGSLLDILLLKKDIENRCALTAPLFKLLSKLFADEWLLELVEKDAKLSEASSWASTICYIQQTVLTILEEISVSLSCDTPQKDNTLQEYDVKLLLECARSATDPTTRNHVLSLVSSIAKNMPEKVFEHIIGIFTVIGESAAKQSDSHSQRVFEDLISTIVPCWLSKASNADSLLQIFVDVLPEIAEHRRLTIMVFFLRTLGERNSLSSLLILLIRSAVKRKNKSGSDEILYASVSSTSVVHTAWEFRFALQVCAQYSCMIWLPSLVRLLKQAQNSDHLPEQVDVLSLVVQFVLQKLQDTELGFKLESGEDSDDIQRTLGALLEQVVLLLQIVNSRGNLQTVPIDVKKELKDSMHSVLKAIIKKMLPSAFFDGINLLLGRENGFMRKKALKLLCEAVNDRDMLRPKHKEKRNPSQNSSYSLLHLDGNSTESFVKMCSNIVQLIDASDEGPDTLLKVAAISTLENLANSFSANTSVFTSCLTSVSKQICSQNLSISCNCLRATGALIKVLDTKEILPELPKIMGTILSKVRNDLCLLKKSKHSSQGTITGVSGLKESLPFSILVTLEAVIEKLGRFLSPYLGDIIELMVLSPELFSESDLKIKVKADAVRKLITEKIDVRYILTPLLEIYHKAVELSESSVLLVFEMLSCLIGKMDRVSISSYHGKIFEKCLLALDLRRAHPESIKNVHLVEKGVIHAMLGLTMKVTETMFRPLFRRSRMWSETLADGHGSTESTSLDRVISFYSFVNELVEHQRSLFVPYFKDLIDGCTRNLMEGQVTQSTGVPHKRKKSKLEKEGENALSLRQWHLRALILSSLQKCFLYDTGSNKFLNSSNFQVLLKPIVSQLIAEPPNSLEEFPDVPSVNEVNDILVSCLGQMAVTAGSDLLWKPLNHEVLMQTRSENVRARILGLRVVKYFVEHLKEEYLVFLPETIPFLGELLEDIELPVKSLAQEILKEMETLSGESLRQYL